MHTPGPWAFTDRKVVDEHLALFRIESESVGYVVAENVDADDAPLISAAPELLAAAKNLLAHWLGKGTRDDDDIEREVRAAIAKAEGGAA